VPLFEAIFVATSMRMPTTAVNIKKSKTDQPHSLKLELPGKPSSLHDSPPVP
jgi:hypothetical protein